MLSLGQTEVSWNPLNRKQVDEAKKHYVEAKKQNRKIISLDGKPIEKFSPSFGGLIISSMETKPDEILVRLVNETGDERVVWNVNDPNQVKESCERFQQYLNKGWKAYAIRHDGSRGIRLFAFDAGLQEVTFDDKSTRQRLKDFAKSFSKIEILPRTFPG